MGNIIVLSIQNTGTWFILKFLEPFFNGIELVPHTIKKGDYIYQLHIAENINNQQRYLYNCIALANTVILPMRDPLLSMATSWWRCKNKKGTAQEDPLSPEERVLVRLSIFCEMNETFKLWKKNNLAFFFPVDLIGNKSVKEKERELHYLLTCVDLEKRVYKNTRRYDKSIEIREKMEAISKEWAEQYPIIRSTKFSKGNPAKEAYKNNDKKWFEKNFPYWEKIRKEEEHLCPFLKQLGYKNLLWWS